MARKAGRALANSATATRTTGTMTNVPGSSGLTCATDAIHDVGLDVRYGVTAGLKRSVVPSM